MIKEHSEFFDIGLLHKKFDLQRKLSKFTDGNNYQRFSNKTKGYDTKN